jgi:hypothetical protein
MNNITRGFATAGLILLISGCAQLPAVGSSTPEKAAPADTRPCAKNFAVAGSALSLSGTTYTSSVTVAGVSKATAMTKASKQIAQDGLTITTMDREGGMIAAANKVIAGKGDTVPLVVTFEPVKGGLDVRMTFRNGFGQVTTEEVVRNGFCGIVAAIEKK